MSEAELAAAVGTAAMVASLVGSIAGSRMMQGNKSKGGSSILGAAGSIMGSMVASEMAASSVRALHQQSIQKIAYKEDCRRAVERGDPTPDAPPSSTWEEVLQKTMDAVKVVTSTTTQNNNEHDTRNSIGDLWNKARAGVQAAANNFDSNNGTKTNNTYR
jgi:hypothetical protein